MNKDVLISNAEFALQLMLYASLPPIIATALIGLLISLILSLTQLQEQTISFIFKLSAMTASLLITGAWIGSEILEYSLHAFNLIKSVK